MSTQFEQDVKLLVFELQNVFQEVLKNENISENSKRLILDSLNKINSIKQKHPQIANPYSSRPIINDFPVVQNVNSSPAAENASPKTPTETPIIQIDVSQTLSQDNFLGSTKQEILKTKLSITKDLFKKNRLCCIKKVLLNSTEFYAFIIYKDEKEKKIEKWFPLSDIKYPARKGSILTFEYNSINFEFETNNAIHAQDWVRRIEEFSSQVSRIRKSSAISLQLQQTTQLHKPAEFYERIDQDDNEEEEIPITPPPPPIPTPILPQHIRTPVTPNVPLSSISKPNNNNGFYQYDSMVATNTRRTSNASTNHQHEVYQDVDENELYVDTNENDDENSQGDYLNASNILSNMDDEPLPPPPPPSVSKPNLNNSDINKSNGAKPFMLIGLSTNNNNQNDNRNNGTLSRPYKEKPYLYKINDRAAQVQQTVQNSTVSATTFKIPGSKINIYNNSDLSLYYLCLYESNPKYELAYKCGDVVELIEMTSKEFFIAKRHDTIGLVSLRNVIKLYEVI